MNYVRETALRNCILRGTVGSRALGISLSDDDIDQMGIFVEPRSHVYGMGGAIDHYIYRDAAEGQRSGPGDLDLTLYSLRKFCYLAAQGNPSILILLYLREYDCETQVGSELVNLRHAFVSKEAGKRFLGYLRAQKSKLNGERSPCVSRPELVEKFGYDTKFAGHAVRLGLQGIEYIETCNIFLPMKEAGHIVNIRKGRYALQAILAEITDIEARLSSAIDRCTLLVDRKSINDYLVSAHESYWQNME